MMLAPHPISRLLLWLSGGVAACGLLAFVAAYRFPSLFIPAGAPPAASSALVSTETPPQPHQPYASTTPPSSTGTATASSQYFQVTGSCGPYFDGAPCLNMRSGPGTSYPVLRQLRNGVLLKIAGSTTTPDGTWYRIGFDGDIHYPERVTSSWYVNAQYVHPFLDPGELEEAPAQAAQASTTKRIVISISKQMLYAYDGSSLFMQAPVSTGLNGTPTPIGQFHVFRKMPDSYMQGPVPGVSSQYYDLPGVPWDLYFTTGGAAIHGAYWHNHFGEKWSHGCVNLPIDKSKILYQWTPLGTPVTVEP